MSKRAEYAIGADVTCSDALCGELSRVVLDPVARALTHLVVEPKHGPRFGRLVPIDLVDDTAPRICLRCTLAEFEALDDAEETHFISHTEEQTGYADDEVFAWPYYGLAAGLGGMGMGGMGAGTTPPFVTYDRVPLGEVDLRRGEHVHASDGDIGRVQGLVIDPSDHHVTHVLLQAGHLWGKHDLAIPIGAVSKVDAGGVQLTITKAQIRDLPPVDVDR